MPSQEFHSAYVLHHDFYFYSIIRNKRDCADEAYKSILQNVYLSTIARQMYIVSATALIDLISLKNESFSCPSGKSMPKVLTQLFFLLFDNPVYLLSAVRLGDISPMFGFLAGILIAWLLCHDPKMPLY